MSGKILKRKYWIVYLNKSFDIWARDGHKWAKDHGFNDADHNNVISETVFHCFLQDSENIIGDAPVYFVRDILAER